jgi:transposase
MRIRPTYTAEFRADALDLLARTDRSINQVARDLGVANTTLRAWYQSAEMAKKKKPKKPHVAAASATDAVERESAKAHIRRLERQLAAAQKEIDDLKTDRAILKKAAAFFAKESE